MELKGEVKRKFKKLPIDLFLVCLHWEAVFSCAGSKWYWNSAAFVVIISFSGNKT